jgi:hypothetical protein
VPAVPSGPAVSRVHPGCVVSEVAGATSLAPASLKSLAAVVVETCVQQYQRCFSVRASTAAAATQGQLIASFRDIVSQSVAHTVNGVASSPSPPWEIVEALVADATASVTGRAVAPAGVGIGVRVENMWTCPRRHTFGMRSACHAVVHVSVDRDSSPQSADAWSQALADAVTCTISVPAEVPKLCVKCCGTPGSGASSAHYVRAWQQRVVHVHGAVFVQVR